MKSLFLEKKVTAANIIFNKPKTSLVNQFKIWKTWSIMAAAITRLPFTNPVKQELWLFYNDIAVYWACAGKKAVVKHKQLNIYNYFCEQCPNLHPKTLTVVSIYACSCLRWSEGGLLMQLINQLQVPSEWWPHIPEKRGNSPEQSNLEWLVSSLRN